MECFAQINNYLPVVLQCFLFFISFVFSLIFVDFYRSFGRLSYFWLQISLQFLVCLFFYFICRFFFFLHLILVYYFISFHNAISFDFFVVVVVVVLDLSLTTLNVLNRAYYRGFHFPYRSRQNICKKARTIKYSKNP